MQSCTVLSCNKNSDKKLQIITLGSSLNFLFFILLVYRVNSRNDTSYRMYWNSMVIGFMYRNGIVKEGCIQEDWRSSVILPVYRGKGDSMECGSYRGIKLL